MTGRAVAVANASGDGQGEADGAVLVMREPGSEEGDPGESLVAPEHAAARLTKKIDADRANTARTKSVMSMSSQ